MGKKDLLDFQQNEVKRWIVKNSQRSFTVCRDAAGGDRGGAKLLWRSVGAV